MRVQQSLEGGKKQQNLPKVQSEPNLLALLLLAKLCWGHPKKGLPRGILALFLVFSRSRKCSSKYEQLEAGKCSFNFWTNFHKGTEGEVKFWISPCLSQCYRAYLQRVPWSVSKTWTLSKWRGGTICSSVSLLLICTLITGNLHFRPWS